MACGAGGAACGACSRAQQARCQTNDLHLDPLGDHLARHIQEVVGNALEGVSQRLLGGLGAAGNILEGSAERGADGVGAGHDLVYRVFQLVQFALHLVVGTLQALAW